MISVERRVVRMGALYGVKCPAEWNGYPVSIVIKPKGLWKGIKYRRFKHEGKWHRGMHAKDASKYSNRLIRVQSRVFSKGRMTKVGFTEFAEVPKKYHSMRCTVTIAMTVRCKKCGELN